PGTPVNSISSYPLTIFEVFLLDGKKLLQLTNFRRVDTGRGFLSADGRRVFFTASADPFGANPSENCQLFSIDRLGGHLRQVTRFREGARSVNGCSNLPPPGAGCNVQVTTQDPVTQTVVFQSSCDPLGTNSNGGGPVFAMPPGGSPPRPPAHTPGGVGGTGGRPTRGAPGATPRAPCWCGGAFELLDRSAFALSPSYLAPLERGIASAKHAFRDFGPELSRQFRALKVWMCLSAYGVDTFARLIAQNVAQATHLAGGVELELLAPAPLNVECFRYRPTGASAAAIDALIRSIRRQ